MTDAPDDDLVARFRNLSVWKRKQQDYDGREVGEERAPHKPLLVLLALGRLQRDEPRLAGFKEIEAPLKSLLREFGPTRRSYHPEYPFWRLQNDDAFWEVAGDGPMRSRQSNTDPPVSVLRDASAAGGFTPAVDTRLRGDPVLLGRVARTLLDLHFPSSIHADICEAVGLAIDPMATTSKSLARSRAFRDEVLRAYEYRCAVCSYDARLDGMHVGLEAAHVRWHSHAGPDAVSNGVAFCSLHHKAFDLGLFTLDDARHIVVSQRLHGGERVESSLVAFHTRPLVGPQQGQPTVAPAHAAWHRSEVFKEPSRAA